jgi:hypothetical protein
MLQIRMNELSHDDSERLRNELIHVLLDELTYPPFADVYKGIVRIRPVNSQDQRRAREFIEAAQLDHLTTIAITSGALREHLTDLFLRYYEAQVARYPQTAIHQSTIRRIAPQLAQQIQKRLVAHIIDGAHIYFGDPSSARSWQKSTNAAPMPPPWEAIATGSLTLAQALAETRKEAETPLPEPLLDELQAISDMATERLPTIDSATCAKDSPPSTENLLTAPLPQSVDEMIPAPKRGRSDRAIFQQIRDQLLGTMGVAARSYGIAASLDDPAGLLAALREQDLIDEGDLRLAEGVLALCGKVIAADRASIDDYREAMTLYLLFNRRRG